MVRFSRLVAEQRWIKEIDINPLLASPDGWSRSMRASSCTGRRCGKEDLPKLAIRPYPNRYVTNWTMKDGSRGADPADPARG